MRRILLWMVALAAALPCGCSDNAPRRLRIGVAFDTLQTEYWVASFEALRAELERRDIEMIEAIADNDVLARATVSYMAEQARNSGKRHKAMILIGDLADINAVGRRDGFEDAVREYPDAIEVVARVPTQWSQDKALAGVTNALQVNPDISFIFTSSDFLFPSLISALKTAGKYQKIGEEGHVLLGGFDGDSLACRMLRDGYLDADGVQDVYFECAASVDAVLRMRGGQRMEPVIRDPGFVIHQDNLDAKAPQMWGAQAAKEDAP